MKTTILILLATLSIAHANLKDLTPGGFDLTQPYPQQFLHFIDQQSGNRITFFDAANPAGWDSCCGSLNGGDEFNTSVIGNPGPTATVSWDFTTLPGWSMSVLFVEGDSWGHLYAVGRNFDTIDVGDLVALHDGLDINSLAFYGRNPDSAPVPDSGSTVALMGLGLLGLGFLCHKNGFDTSTLEKDSLRNF